MQRTPRPQPPSSRQQRLLALLALWSAIALAGMTVLHNGLDVARPWSSQDQLFTIRRSSHISTDDRSTDDRPSTERAAPSHTLSPELQRLLRQRQRIQIANDLVVAALVPITAPRGIVFPLFDKIAALGVSLLLQLQELGVDLPIEVPHCGDLSADWRFVLETGNIPAADMSNNNNSSTTLSTGLRLQVRVYDVCEMAQQTRYSMASAQGDSTGAPMFCDSPEHCHFRFRSFDIKILALLLSGFDEVMLMDADTQYFSSPMALWSTNKYRETGTLFFHDRISFERSFLDQPWFPPRETPVNSSVDSSGSGDDTIAFPGDASRGMDAVRVNSSMADQQPIVPQSNASKLQMYLHNADVSPFRHLSKLARDHVSPHIISQLNLTLPFQPSAFLLQSHSWNRRAGHQLDSSLLLWHKSRQSRATAILASFIALNTDVHRPPSYGDKELFFVACELAETAYAFSDFAVGAIGHNRP
ncbi:hypothetical protein ATCC90586_005330 [Pythium insidiosum]|nr:hypothetical protein ATCC90586_005330 [Pythium insidiosum]